MCLPFRLNLALLGVSLCLRAGWSGTALAVQPFQPVVGDPVLEPWRWRVFPELGVSGLQCMAESQEGRLWFGTAEGATYFDGLNWTSYTAANGLGGAVDTLCTGPDGTAYAGGAWGISQFRNGRWSRFFPAPGQTFGTIRRLVLGRDGALWAASSWGALRFNGAELVVYTGPEGAAILQTNQNAGRFRLELLPAELLARPRRDATSANRSDFFEAYADHEGRVWLGTEAGEVLCFRPAAQEAAKDTLAPPRGEWTLYNEADGLVLNRRPRILQLRNGVVWVVSYGSLGRANQFDGRVWKSVRLSDLGASDDCSCLLETRDGVLWIGCNGSVCANRNGRWQAYQPPKVPIPTVRTLLLQTSDGALWIGGQDSQVLRLDYQTPRWLTYPDLNFQWQSPQGAQWFLHRNGRVVVREGEGWRSYGPEDGVIDSPVTLLGARDGEIWVAGSHEHTAATARFDGQAWHRDLHERLSWGIDWRAAFEASDGSLWFGASVDSAGLGKDFVGGLMQYRQGQWIHHEVTTGFFERQGQTNISGYSNQARDPIGKFYGLGETRDGRIWGGQFVITCFDGQKWQIFNEPPGVRIGVLEALCTTRERDLWIGSRQYGVFRFDGRHWRHFTVKDGLIANTIRSITQTADGALWVATDRGISRYDGESWSGGILPEVLNLPREGGSLKAAPSGALWINRASRAWNRRAWPKSGALDPASEFWTVCYQKENQAPRTVITFGSDKISQPGNTTISWSGLDPWRTTKEEDLNYSFRLDAQPWSRYSRQASHAFFELPAGPHRFQVRARDQDFNVDPTPATLEFVVAPPVWRQAWFLGLMLALGGVIATQTARVLLHGRRLRRINQSLTAEIDTRQRLERQMLLASHQAGMAEVATSILHNVGNVLNSVNVSSNLVADRLRRATFAELPKVADLLEAHAPEPNFLTESDKGRKVPPYLKQLAVRLSGERDETLKELGSLQQNIDHIKDIISTQQEYSRLAGFAEAVTLPELVEDAIRLNGSSLARHRIALVRDFQERSAVRVEKHRVLQILVNLIRNGSHACEESHQPEPRLLLRTLRAGADRVQIQVIDNGVGIATENLTRIFAQGFTTRKNGHGFGLHSAANAARELSGSLTVHSDGPGKGACFTLEIPVDKNRGNAADSASGQPGGASNAAPRMDAI